MTLPDFAARQQVEGFAAVVSNPNRDYAVIGKGATPDFRGPCRMAMTRDWARPSQADEPPLEWQTAAVPRAVDTTFSFTGESGNLPENAYPPNQATLYVNDEPAITFDLGQRQPRLWVQGDWALDFTPKQVHASFDHYHRHICMGCSGVYRLAAPARALVAGQPLRLKIVLDGRRSDASAWFGVRHRTDTLEQSDSVNAQQIQQLQTQIIDLKRAIGTLARRQYADLFVERLRTEDVIVYGGGASHVHDSDVIRLHNGDLLACFREGLEHMADNAVFAMVRSRDGGKTWGERQVLRQHAHTDERSGSLCQLRDGTILADHWPNRMYDLDGYYAYKVVHDKGRRPGMYVGRSTDNGHAWSWPAEPVDPAPFPAIYTAEHIVELPSGRLILPVYYWIADGDRWGSAVFCSEDEGLSWRYLATVADVPGVKLDEPALVVTKTGRLVCILRNDSGDVYYQTNSDDGGQTWTPASPTPIPGYYNPACLTVLPDNTVLCIYSSRGDPCGIYVVASYDNGATWDMAHRRVLRDDFPTNNDSTYPSAVVMPDGRVFTTYYFNLFGRFYIAGSFFRWERDQ